MNALLQDLRYALRALLKRPSYALIAVAVLAIAIGANTTIFSVLSGLLLNPLPYPDGDRLVVVYNTYPALGLEVAGTSVPDYLDRRERAQSLEDLAIYTGDGRTLGGEGRPERVIVMRASASLFDVLGIAPQLGRAFTADDAASGEDRVAVLSDALWSSRFGAREDIVGQDVVLDGERFRIVGVMPKAFGFPNRNVSAWVPFPLTPEETTDQRRGMEYSQSIGRLRAGATIGELNAELDGIVHANVELGRERQDIESTGFTGRARTLRDMTVGDLEQMLLILQGIVLAVLLMACANVANLQLARIAARRRELGVRMALGAATGRLARLVLAESLLLAAAGAGGGLVIALGGLDLVRRLGFDFGPQGLEFALDAKVLAFTAGVAVLAALAASLLPLVALRRDDLARAAHEGARSRGGPTGQRFRSALVVLQIGIGVALLVGAGLLAKSFYTIQGQDTGFNADGVWTARIAVPQSRYPDAQTPAFYERVVAELSALPGVTEVGFTSALPFGGNDPQGSYEIEGFVPANAAAEPHARQRVINEGYLPSLGIPVVLGRNFMADERENVVIVDELFARRYFPAGDALGHRLRFISGPQWWTIVGVVPSVKHTGLADDSAKETLYWHYAQIPQAAGMLTVHTTLAPEQIARAATDAVLRVDPDVPLSNAMPMSARIAQSLGPQRTPLVLTLVFAAVAFTLAVVGVYGVLTWAVAQRVGEIGVRMALGARARDVAVMILVQGGRLTLIGLAVGAAGAVVLGRLLATQIYEVSPGDPAVFAAAFLGLGATALLASWLPARRAARVDPMAALRQE